MVRVMFSWLEELYRIRRENKACETCDVLKMENARLLIENGKLLDRILEKPVEQVIEQPKEFKPILPRSGMSWNVRRQMLENESKRQAQIIKQREQEDKVEKISTEDLEKELDIVQKEREENAV